MFEHLWDGAGKVLELKIDGMLTDRETGQIGRLIEDCQAQAGAINLLLDIEGFPNMDPEGLLENVKFLRTYEAQVKQLAVVSNRVWIKSWILLGGLFLQTQVRYFDRSERVRARQWLQEST